MVTPKLATARPAAIDLVLAVYVYTFLEWLFLVTKPSFLSVLTLQEKVAVVLVATLPLLALALGLYLLCLMAARLVQRPAPARGLERLPEALIYTALALLLFDNFTYTVLGIGVISTSGPTAYGYLALLIILLGWLWLRCSGAQRNARERAAGWKLWVAGILVLASTAATVLSLAGTAHVGAAISSSRENPPTIVFFASDGVDADLLSGYGSDYATSPNLDALMQESLVFNAALSNSARTTGSTVSLLNGKYPTTTKVLFPPHVLTGADSFEHLPGILRRAGYTLFQESIRYYADAPDLNMQEAFHIANRRSVKSTIPSWLPSAWAVAVPEALLFIDRLKARITERLLHLTGVRCMEDVYAQVSSEPAKVYGFRDRGRIDAAIKFIGEQSGPLFLHIHLMDSHCCRFRPAHRNFSKEFSEQTDDNMQAYLADAVLSSDMVFGELIEALKVSGRLKNTLIVYSSDHGVRWRANRRMPLVIRFPKGEHANRIDDTVQLLDVAPTILDYLDVSQPPWMEGDSLLGGFIDRMRPVFSVGGVDREVIQTQKDKVSRLVGSGPPLYGIKTMQMTVCSRWYSLALETGRMRAGRIPDHPRPCGGGQTPPVSLAREMIVEHLSQRGFVLPVATYEDIVD